ncbi:hypothetical protein L2E82_51059 [Cichorium intybus]|nr:hypothetical protein L2E82_51059 [Cichorium intybus]
MAISTVTDATTQAITEMVTVNTSSFTPPPSASTPLTKEKTIHTEKEVTKKSAYGPKKRLPFESKSTDSEEGEKKAPTRDMKIL